VIVADVAPNSPPDEAGLQPGDVITAVARRPVRSVEDVRRALATKADRVLLTVRRDGTSLFVEMRR
jgi:S1-C subfamily serine protease